MKALKRVERIVADISCGELEQRLDKLLENELDMTAALECEEHIQVCKACKTLHDELKDISVVASSLLSTPVPDEVRMRLRQRLSEETGISFSRIKPSLSLVK